MANSEMTQQVSAEALFFTEAKVDALIAKAKAITQHEPVKVEALIAEAMAIFANFRLNRDGRELNERLLALGIALTATFGGTAVETETEEEKRHLALGFIAGAISDGRSLEKNLLALFRHPHQF